MNHKAVSLWLILTTFFIGAVIFSCAGYYFGSKTQKAQEAILVTPSPTPIATDEESEFSAVELPFPVIRVGEKVSYADWKFYKDKSGYGFYYPENWFVSETGNQVQNWNPNSVGRPVTLNADQAKWDLYFGEHSFSSFGEVIASTSPSVGKWDSLEISSTIKGMPVYFAIKEAVEPMDSPYLIAIVRVSDKETIILSGFAGDTKGPNIEILKQIVESIQK